MKKRTIFRLAFALLLVLTLAGVLRQRPRAPCPRSGLMTWPGGQSMGAVA